jgi:hypothetical protein
MTCSCRIDDRLFVHEDDPNAKAQQITCHELTHACTAHLKLPAWLNEGLAMVTAEHFAGKPLVEESSRALLAQPADIGGSVSKQAAKPGGLDAIVALYARGYWRTRYLEETRPGLLRAVLTQPRHPSNWDDTIAAACQADGASFWSTVDASVLSYREKP